MLAVFGREMRNVIMFVQSIRALRDLWIVNGELIGFSGTSAFSCRGEPMLSFVPREKSQDRGACIPVQAVLQICRCSRRIVQIDQVP